MDEAIMAASEKRISYGRMKPHHYDLEKRLTCLLSRRKMTPGRRKPAKALDPTPMLVRIIRKRQLLHHEIRQLYCV